MISKAILSVGFLVAGYFARADVLMDVEREIGLTRAEHWAGRKRHPAVVNSVTKLDSPDLISLAGEWAFTNCSHGASAYGAPRKAEKGLWRAPARIRVPGVWEAQGFGEPAVGVSHLSDDASPKRLRHFRAGKGHYLRSVEIPDSWAGKRVWLKIGGVTSQGWFFVNGTAVGMIDTYAGAWKFDVTDCIVPGTNAQILAVVDNAVGTRNAQPATVNRWGGLIRDVELEATPMECYIDDAWVRGDFDGRCAEAKVEIAGEVKAEGEGEQRMDSFSLRVTVEGETKESTLHSSPSSSTYTLELPLRQFRPWSPEHPNLYTAKVELVENGRVVQTRLERFGVRKLEVRGKEFYLNGRPFFFRGFGDDSVYPITGYSPASREYHLAHLRLARAAGFNFVRLHTHCELPEYFEAADEAGILVQAELSYYFDNVDDHFSYDPFRDAVDRWIALRRYPSWAISCSGNEGKLGPVACQTMYRTLKRLDPDRLVQDQDGPHDECETVKANDFQGGPLNIWDRGSYDPDSPFLCHEYLNLAVKQDSRLEREFSGIWEPMVTRDERAGILGKAGLTHAGWGDRLQDAQHALQRFWQKYGVESARRDPYCDGYCYWTIVDVGVFNKTLGLYTAQGLFDSFWRPKSGGATAADFAEFNSPSCLLLELENRPLPPPGNRTFDAGWYISHPVSDTNRVFVSGQEIPATFMFAHYGDAEIADARLSWTLAAEDGAVLAKGGTDVGGQAIGAVRTLAAERIAVPELQKPVRATLVAKLTGGCADGREVDLANRWTLYLFPKRAIRPASDVACAATYLKALSARYEGMVSAEEDDGRAAIVIAEEGSASARRALETGKMLVTLSGQSGEPNFRLGWWWIGKQCGTAIVRHPMIADLPYEPFLSPLLFRIIRTGTELPVADVSERDLVIAGEGGSAFYLYLSDSVGAHGAHHVRISGLDVVSDTPEGTALLDGVLGYLRRIAAETRRSKGGSENGKS